MHAASSVDINPMNDRNQGSVTSTNNYLRLSSGILTKASKDSFKLPEEGKTYENNIEMISKLLQSHDKVKELTRRKLSMMNQ